MTSAYAEYSGIHLFRVTFYKIVLLPLNRLLIQLFRSYILRISSFPKKDRKCIHYPSLEL